MNDAEESGDLGMDEAFDPAAVIAAPALRSALADVAKQRHRDDGEEGYFRDYRDGTEVSGMDLLSFEEAAKRRKKAGSQVTWRHQLDCAAAYVAMKRDERELRTALVNLAALSVAWVEALDRRKDEKRIALKTAPLPVWKRALMRFGRMLRRNF